MNINESRYIVSLAEKGIRADGRKLLDLRKDVVIEYGISKNAEGSARVTMGKTVVNCGVKLELGTPYPDRPNEGSMIVTAELSPISSKAFEPGPPTEEGVELARVVDRGIRESHAIDTKKLCIKESEKIWMVLIDLYIQNHDGNLIDVCSLAAIAALKNAKFPKYDEETKRIDYHEKTDKALPINHTPISCTVWKIDNHLIVDPTFFEETEMDARLTIIMNEEGDINGLQKSGSVGLSIEEIHSCIDIATEKTKELRAYLE